VKLYKAFLVLVVAVIITLFFFPRLSAKADTPLFNEAPEAPIPQMIEQYALSYGVSPKVALAVASCESRLDPLARNPSSTAKGIYQFLDSSWDTYSTMKWGRDKDVLNAKDNIELGVWVLATVGTQPWESSEGCWSHNL